jgi:hypothetical protein
MNKKKKKSYESLFQSVNTESFFFFFLLVEKDMTSEKDLLNTQKMHDLLI